MRAVVMRGAEQFATEDWPKPDPADGQVLVRMAYAGICGSDLSYAFKGRVGNFVITDPLVAGHEVCGEVVEDPSGQFTPGTPVVVHPATFGQSQPQIADQPHLWPGGTYLGSAAVTPHCQGAMAEYAVFRPDQLRVVPADLDLRTAVLAEPLGVALHAVSLVAGQLPGARVLVSGAGPIGLLVLAALQDHPTASVAAVDLVDGPLGRASALGAGETINATTGGLAPESYDIIFEATGAPVAISAAVNAAARAGTIVQVGSIPGGPQPIDLASLVAKELTLRGSFRFHTEINDAVTLLARHPEWAQVITHEFGLEDAGAAFATARDSQESGKVIVRLR